MTETRPPAPTFRRSARARRLILRIAPSTGHAEVVVPARVSMEEARRFASRHAGWLADRLRAAAPSCPFADGAVIPVGGVDHVIRHDPGHRGRPLLRDGVLVVGGGAPHLTRRVRDFLAAEARRVLTERSHAFARRIGARPAAVSIRDTTSRWGSCSAAGKLSFCWRLILAPPAILDYVAAHEVAHLREMNHGPGFWALVGALMPDFEASRAWLKLNGPALLRIGRADPP